jgi:hypothetical protein
MAGLLDTLSSYASRAASPIDYMSIPANARLLAKSMFYPTNVNESSFTNPELNALREAYANTQSRVVSPEATSSREVLDRLSTVSPNEQVLSKFNKGFVPSELEKEMLISNISPTLQYEDYPVYKNGSPYGVGNMPLSKSFTDPSYAMATTIGRAKYFTDSQGNVHVSDTYDFPKGSNMEDYGAWSMPFKAAHTFGEMFSQKMPVDINLGKIKSILDKKKVK